LNKRRNTRERGNECPGRSLKALKKQGRVKGEKKHHRCRNLLNKKGGKSKGTGVEMIGVLRELPLKGTHGLGQWGRFQLPQKGIK